MDVISGWSCLDALSALSLYLSPETALLRGVLPPLPPALLPGVIEECDSECSQEREEVREEPEEEREGPFNLFGWFRG